MAVKKGGEAADLKHLVHEMMYRHTGGMLEASLEPGRAWGLTGASSFVSFRFREALSQNTRHRAMPDVHLWPPHSRTQVSTPIPTHQQEVFMFMASSLTKRGYIGVMGRGCLSTSTLATAAKVENKDIYLTHT